MRNQTARNHIAYRHSKTGTDIELQTLDNSNLGNDLKLNSIMFQNDKQGISNHKQHKGNNGRRMGFILLICKLMHFTFAMLCICCMANLKSGHAKVI